MSFLLRDVENDLEFDKVRNIVSRECRSGVGCDYLLMAKPFKTRDEAQEELSVLSEMRSFLTRVSSFPCYGHIDEAFVQCISVSGTVLESDVLLALKGTLQNIREMKTCLEEDTLEDFPLLSSAVEKLFFDEELLDELQRTLDVDGSVLESASPELAAARKEQRSLQLSIESQLNGYLRDAKYKECFDTAYITTINDRFVIPVYTNFKGRIGGVVQGTSNSGNSVFVEPVKVVEMNNSLMTARAREKAEIHRILASLTAQASQNVDSYKTLFWQLSWFDSLYARARYANGTASSYPKFAQGMELNLKNVRHPLLGEDCIPLSMSLEDGHSVVVLSGANSGGKTVTLKTVGLAALMARTGFHILADENSVVPFFPLIFVEIGDRQSIAEHLSSFSSHITDISHILKRVAPGSLVLLDEIMSGTDPEEGAVLAEAVLKELSDKGCLVITTTHFGTLKMLSGKNPAFRNYAVEFNSDTFEPTFRLLSDVPGASYGFEIARRFGLPSRIVDAAGELLGDGRHRISELVLQLEKELTAAQNLADTHRKSSQKAEKLSKKLEKQFEQFEKDKEEQLTSLIEKERRRLLDFRKTIEQELSMFRDSVAGQPFSANDHSTTPSQDTALVNNDADGGQARSGRTKPTRVSILNKVDRKLVSLKGVHRRKQTAMEQAPLKIEEGARVKTIDGTMKGTVRKVNERKQTVVLDCNGLELTVSFDEIQVISPSADTAEKKKSLPSTPLTSYTAEIGSTLPYELDLRGMRVHEAIEKLESHIDLAIARHATSIRIIHGKGTGALKRAVEEYLHAHPVITGYRRGKQGEGDFGVTIATL